MLPYARQSIVQSDIDAVVEVLKSDFLTQGPIVPRFEETVAHHVSSSHAVATNSATSSLHVACLSLGLSSGDSMWTVPNSFVASANCALLCGAEVDFVDINLTNYSMDVGALECKLKKAQDANYLPKALVVVHYSGRSADMKEIAELADHYGVQIIEDAAHAIGGEYLGNPIGSCQFSAITVFSFHPVKIMTTAEGGLAVTNNSNLAKKMSIVRTHGVTRNQNEMFKNNPQPWEYEQIELGLNYRMTEVQAALGLSQFERLSSFVQRRRQLAQQYDEQLRDLPLILPEIHPLDESAWHLYPVLVNAQNTNLTRDHVYFSLLEKGIKANVHFIPIHIQPYFQKKGFRPGDFPNSEWFYAHQISLPMYFDLTDEEQQFVIDALRTTFNNEKITN